MKIKDEDFDWSGDIDIDAVGVHYFQILSKDKSKKIFFSIDIRYKDNRILLILK
jgi:hypothetical protein